MKYILWCFAIVGLVTLNSCSGDTEVGSGLLGSEDLDVVFEEDFAISAKTIIPESLLSYFESTTSAYPIPLQALGTQYDPIFGKTTSSLYMVPSIGAVTDRLDTIRFDSLVLTLSIDTTFYYGDTLAPMDLEVFELLERVDGDSIFSDVTYQVSTEPVGVRNQVVISTLDSVEVPATNTTNFDSTITVSNILRIPLDRDHGFKVLTALQDAQSTSEFSDQIFGYEVKAKTEDGLFFINLPFSDGGGLRNSIIFYYRDTDGLRQEFPVVFGRRNFPVVKQITQDRSGSTIESIIDVPVSENDLLYLKALGAAYVELNLSDAMKLQGELINHAALEFFVPADLDRDTVLFPLADQLALLRKEGNSFVAIQDLVLENRFFAEGIFGGERELDSETGLIRYEMNITTYLKELVKGEEDGTVFISIFDELQSANSAILYGPDHPDYPIKLKVTYTKS